MKLSKPIRPGYRRSVKLVPDFPVDQLPGGVYAKATIVSGNSTVEVRPESTEKEILLWVNGDGAIGSKSAQIKVDGRIGEGEVELNVDLEWDVAHPDATKLEVTEGEDELIPVPETPTA